MVLIRSACVQGDGIGFSTGVRIAFFFGLLFVCLPSSAPNAADVDQPFMIAENGKPQCVIVVAGQPSAAEQTAAIELQSILKQVTGAELPIQTCTEVEQDAKQIVVGPSERFTDLLPNTQLDEVGDDGIVIHGNGNALVLAGPRPRGTLYAVYSFLEDQVGCRWWTPTEDEIPHRPTLSIPPLSITYSPKLKSREAYYRDAFEAKFSARQKLNGHSARTGPSLGGNIRFTDFVHTFFPFLPPKVYFDQHPEWYSLIDGKRVHEKAQLCLTNDEMQAEMTRVVLERLAKNPGAKLISISQNDCRGPCQCENCQAVVDEEGSQAGPLLRFVNAISAVVEKEFPDVWVETLAYQYTRAAPLKVRPRSNVVVRLCSIECSFVETLGEGEQNEPFRKDIEAWSKITPQLFVWDYVTNFSNYLVPHPNLRVLAPNVRFFVDHSVVGLFEQGDSQSGIGDFVRLRAWLLAHLMWNPDQDEEALIDEFLRGYYGPAAPHLRDYLNLINDAGERDGIYLRCFMTDTSAWLTLDDLNRATELFAKAESAVSGDAALAARVRRERLPLDHVWLSRYKSLKRSALIGNTPFAGPDDLQAACEDFIRVCRREGVGNWRERHPFDERANLLIRKSGPPAALPPQAAGVPPADWIDYQDGEFSIARAGEWAEFVEDTAASDGHAVRMPGNHFEWAASLPLSDDIASLNPWHVYVAARCEATTQEGNAMTMGIYDSAEKKSVAHQSVLVQQAAGAEYRLYDLGTHTLSGSMYIWVAPPKRPGKVQSVYVDRVFMIRSPQ
ncbi:DUF4838 domain-containing protein [Novipirellula artificiosorum]|uniref:Alpha glucuronidase N-terminal domain-containing protein n=1 Tax=Novipirellula artificiosorum TaxID=2528016 RepID=A0A5C6D0S3_9BACT|nr:DUF4838 domain-containing protein [Novipirellula artificiosorum]TWU28776.1 hypothetical protein Poly41_68790 [Novipirellula artificiosorum]